MADEKHHIFDNGKRKPKNSISNSTKITVLKEILWSQSWLNNDDYCIVRFSFLLCWLFFVFPYLLVSRQIIGYRAFYLASFFSLSSQSTLSNKRFKTKFETTRQKITPTANISPELNTIDKKIENNRVRIVISDKNKTITKLIVKDGK